MIGLLAGRDIALGYEIDYLLPGRLIDIPYKDAEGPMQGGVSDDPLRCSRSRPPGILNSPSCLRIDWTLHPRHCPEGSVHLYHSHIDRPGLQ